MRVIEGSFSTVSWSPDGRTVAKRMTAWPLARFAYERRVNRLIARHPPPVPFPRLVATDRRSRTLVYEAVDGDPMGPKYPADLTSGDVDDLIALAAATVTYRPRQRWLRTISTSRAMNRDTRRSLASWMADERPPLVFSHGDISARNVLRARDGRAVLIDWEWAGIYPRGWELAFVWYTVVDSPGARERVEAAVPSRDRYVFERSVHFIDRLHADLRLRRAATEPVLPGRGGRAR